MSEEPEFTRCAGCGNRVLESKTIKIGRWKYCTNKPNNKGERCYITKIFKRLEKKWLD